LYSQADKKIVTKYIRPSVLNLLVAPSNSREEIIIGAFRELKMVNKFDDHNINYPYLKLSLPPIPSPPTSTGIEALIELKQYNSKLKEIDSLRKVQIDQHVYKTSKPIVAKWWSRDSNGDFDYSLVSERGIFTATDADVLTNQAAAVSRLEMMGETLLNKTYAVVYALTKVKSMEEIYNERDAAGAKNKDYKPAKRTDEGFQLEYSAFLYKLNFGDSVLSIFYNNYWSSKEQHDNKKVLAWKTASFPMDFIVSVGGFASAIQSNDPKSYTFSKRRSMEELLKELPSAIQEDAIFKFTKKVEDFQLKAPIFQEVPLTAKLGKKEGLSLDQRFYIYEIQLKGSNNQQFKKRMGVARSTSKIADNNTIASGDTNPSVFKQQGGRKLYQGMLLEEHNDNGLIISVGYQYNPADLSIGGYAAGIEYNISKQIYKAMPKPFIPGGLYLGVNVSANMMTNIHPGFISDGTNILTDNSGWGGYTMVVEGIISKEVYFTRKGNIYLLPSFAYGASLINFSNHGNPNDFDDLSTEEKKLYEWNATIIGGSLGFGMNFGPSVSIIMKPGFVYKSAYSTGEKAPLVNVEGCPRSVDENWKDVFTNISMPKTSLPITLSIRIRY